MAKRFKYSKSYILETIRDTMEFLEVGGKTWCTATFARKEYSVNLNSIATSPLSTLTIMLVDKIRKDHTEETQKKTIPSGDQLFELLED